MKLKPANEKKNIVILGGGFAGIRCALDLDNYLLGRQDFEIILVDSRDYQCYHAGLYEAATVEHGLVEVQKTKRTVIIPYTDIFSKTKVKVFKAYIDRIDTAASQVVTDSRIFPYDYLVIAMGSVADFSGIPNLDKYGFTLKSLEDAIMIRNRIEDIVVKKDQAQIIVGGGGLAGSEFAGKLHNLLKHECQQHDKDPNNFKILVVEGATSFLPGLSDKVSEVVAQRLKQMGVEARFSNLITEVQKGYVVLNMKEQITCDLLVWAGGVRSYRLPIDRDLERDKKDRTITELALNLKDCPNIFVAGDNLCFIDSQTNKAALPTASEAKRHGALVAKNIYRLIRGKPLLPYYPAGVKFTIPVTGKLAVFYTPNLIVSGFPGWLISKFADLRYFLSVLPLKTALKFWLFKNKIIIKND